MNGLMMKSSSHTNISKTFDRQVAERTKHIKHPRGSQQDPDRPTTSNSFSTKPTTFNNRQGSMEFNQRSLMQQSGVSDPRILPQKISSNQNLSSVHDEAFHDVHIQGSIVTLGNIPDTKKSNDYSNNSSIDASAPTGFTGNLKSSASRP